MTRQGPRAPVGEHRVPPTFGSGSLQISADAYEADGVQPPQSIECEVGGDLDDDAATDLYDAESR